MKKEKEMKLKTELNSLVTEYCSLERDKETYYTKHLKDKSRDAIYSLYLRQRLIDNVVKRIAILVENLMSHDVDIDNEIALMLFDEYERSL